MAISERETTVNVSGLTAVEFSHGYPYFSVRNDGNDIIYVSLSDADCTPGANGVTAFPSGGTGVVGINVSGGHTTLYFNGSGTMSVTAQYDAICRYGSAGGGGSGSGDYVLPVATDRILGGVRSYDVLVGPDGKMYVSYINGIPVVEFINDLISIALAGLTKFEIRIVDNLPIVGDPTKIYWIPIPDSNYYHQWAYIDGEWRDLDTNQITLNIVSKTEDGLVPKGDGHANCYLGTDADGNVMWTEFPEGGDYTGITPIVVNSVTRTISVKKAASSVVGVVKPDNETTEVSEDGTMSAKVPIKIPFTVEPSAWTSSGDADYPYKCEIPDTRVMGTDSEAFDVIFDFNSQKKATASGVSQGAKTELGKFVLYSITAPSDALSGVIMFYK